MTNQGTPTRTKRKKKKTKKRDDEEPGNERTIKKQTNIPSKASQKLFSKTVWEIKHRAATKKSNKGKLENNPREAKKWQTKPEQLVKTNPHNLFIFKLFQKYF